MKTREEALNYGLSFPNTYMEMPFHDPNWQLVRVKGSKKAFLWTYEKDGCPASECEDRSCLAGLLAQYLFFRHSRAYHQNKDHWNTIILDGSIPDEDIRRMIAESYDLVTDSPTKRIYEAVKKIPKGCVATYGQVAAMAGEPKMARAVGNALHKNPDPDHIPCYRVVNSKGELSGAFAFGGSNEQANRLRADGIEVTGNKVDLQKFGISL